MVFWVVIWLSGTKVDIQLKYGKRHLNRFLACYMLLHDKKYGTVWDRIFQKDIYFGASVRDIQTPFVW